MKNKLRIWAILWALSVFYNPLLAEAAQVYKPGEKVIYDIKKLALTVGEAVLTYKGAAEINGIPVVLITLSVSTVQFSDLEEIYLDPHTFYPLVIKRDINLFGKKELIIEEYDQSSGRVKITKKVNGREEHHLIEKGSALDNIYGFIYRYRDKGKFQLGEKLFMNLPTENIEITLLKKEELKLNKQKYNTFYMEGDPKGIKIWFEDGSGRLPLKIVGAVGFGKTSMVFRETRR